MRGDGALCLLLALTAAGADAGMITAEQRPREGDPAAAHASACAAAGLHTPSGRAYAGTPADAAAAVHSCSDLEPGARVPAHTGVVRWRTRACTCRRGEVAYAYVQTPRGPVGTLSAAGARITHAHDDPVEHARRLVPPNAFAEYGRIVRMSTRGRPAAFDDAHRRAPFGSPFTRPSMDPEGTGDTEVNCLHHRASFMTS